MRLPASCWRQDGTLLGIPIVFDTDREDIVVGDKLLITYKGQNIGTLTVESKYVPDKVRAELWVGGCGRRRQEHAGH